MLPLQRMRDILWRGTIHLSKSCFLSTSLLMLIPQVFSAAHTDSISAVELYLPSSHTSTSKNILSREHGRPCTPSAFFRHSIIFHFTTLINVENECCPVSADKPPQLMSGPLLCKDIRWMAKRPLSWLTEKCRSVHAIASHPST